MREAEVSIAATELAAMGIEELVALAGDAGLRDLEALACRGNGAVLQLDLETPLDEAALDGLDYVDRYTYVTERADSHVYVVSFTAPDLPARLGETADELVGTCDPEVEGDGATLSLVGPHEAISGHLGDYEAAGVSPTLRRIGAYDGPEHPLDELTERQREVLETAWDLGYYDVPKAASAADVGAELELDPSTVTEHLQRAERTLLGRLL